jgi:mRNA-degrading endonuclease RelE of RelBE toxin-antitoxin system
LSLYTIDLSFADFVEEYKQALKSFSAIKENLSEALSAMELNPGAGDAIPGYSRTVWKIRIGVRGRFGKRGGYRMIYHVNWEKRVITPIALYFKGDVPDLPIAELRKRLIEVGKVIGNTETSPPPPEQPN